MVNRSSRLRHIEQLNPLKHTQKKAIPKKFSLREEDVPQFFCPETTLADFFSKLCLCSKEPLIF